MELPPEIVSIIKEYSMPLTNPNWKTIHKMTKNKFHTELMLIIYNYLNNKNKFRINVLYIIWNNISKIEPN